MSFGIRGVAAVLIFASALPALAKDRAECVVIRSLTTGETHISDHDECGVRTVPASTFKIANTVIALEAGVITDVDAVMPWDGTPQPVEPWNSDHNTRTAMRDSVVWFYRDVARRIGEERMHGGLQRIGYPRDFRGSVDLFWLDERMDISPIEQVTFLTKLFTGRTAADPANVLLVRELLLQPQGYVHGFPDLPLDWPPGAELRAKTGNASMEDRHTSWLVGEARCGSEVLVFAARVRDHRSLPRRSSVALAMRALNRRSPASCE